MRNIYKKSQKKLYDDYIKTIAIIFILLSIAVGLSLLTGCTTLQSMNDKDKQIIDNEWQRSHNNPLPPGFIPKRAR